LEDKEKIAGVPIEAAENKNKPYGFSLEAFLVKCYTASIPIDA
jgi:hypothetical protein